MALLAQVAVSDATLYYDKLYTYEVPEHLAQRVQTGSMVLAPFGRGNARPRTGVVMAVEQGEADARTKALYDAAPEEAALTEELLAIVRYLKEASFCTWYEAVRAVIPYGAQYKAEKRDGGWALQSRLTRYTETAYTVLPETQPPRKAPTPKQQTVLEFIGDKARGREEILRGCGVGRGVLDTLEKNGWLCATERDREPGLVGALEPRAGAPEGLPELTKQQAEAERALGQKMQQRAPRPALLYGVTGSGKTAVFLHLLQRALDAGKTALVLVPEIGLTPQMLGQLRRSFGGRVAVQHSGLAHTQRLLQWRQIQRGEAQIVVGTRSAVFAPLENIGLIVVDEEQERTYQSESAPRYDAIEVARRRAAHHGALLVLASATPAVTDYYAAEQGKYDLVCLGQRYGDMPLPTVELVDMGAQQLSGGAGAISAQLAEAMRQNMEKGWQTILLLNRRGYHRVGLCRDCGEALKCGACSVPMVYHKKGERLLCHYCGQAQSPPPEKCPTCGGEIRYAGFGTQRVEEELAQLLPEARVLRMDMDSTSRKGAHESMLRRFGHGGYDIMLGTQMVAKGLDFERVNLVGVIGIDSLLYSQGYRAYENVFSLVTQVVGRSGRAGQAGRAIIQTVDVENPVLQLGARQDYPAFYRQEIEFRRLGLYPPFCSVCTVGFVSGEEMDALGAARRFAQILAAQAAAHPEVPLRILGPAPMSVVQVAGAYRYRLTLKCRADAAFRALVREALAGYDKEGLPRKAAVYLDMHGDGA